MNLVIWTDDLGCDNFTELSARLHEMLKASEKTMALFSQEQ